MKIEKFNTYLANLGDRFGDEPGKIRPVVVVQTDLLNREHHSTTIVCPITSRVNLNLSIIRVHLNVHSTGLTVPSDVMIDQVRSIDNSRFTKHLGRLNAYDSQRIVESLSILIRE